MPACLAKEKKEAGMTPSKDLKPPPPPVAKAPAKEPVKKNKVKFAAADDVRLISPRKREAGALEEPSDRSMKQARRNVELVIAEDRLAHQQISGHLDKTVDTDLLGKEADQKMPAEVRHGHEHGSETSEFGQDFDLLEDGDDQGQRLALLGDVTHREGAEEVAAFLEHDYLPLHNPGLTNQQPIPDDVLDPDHNHDRQINVEPNTQMRDEFRAYCNNARDHFLDELTQVQGRSVRLLAMLKRKKAPLDTYDDAMEWHHRENGDIKPYETTSSVSGYLSRTKVMDLLKVRYRMTDKFGLKKSLVLPSSRAKVEIICHDAWHCVESLLTDPRICDDDYNFRDNDPFKPPPEVGTIGELHTGRAYKSAYDQFITDPERQVLLPFIAYIDGAVTGQFMNLPITALKIALGIHTRKHRDREHAWRTLGYVPQVSKPGSRGKHLFSASGHLDGQNEDQSEGEGDVDATEVHPAQDFHAMLDVILESFLDVQKHGFIWDLRYRGKTYKDVEFVPFLMFIKCDTEEGDLLCGSYTCRSSGVSQLCRYCCCPTNESDSVKARFPWKTVSMMKSFLVEPRNDKMLQKLSQQPIWNAWHKVRFNPHSALGFRGIHGACPSEMLHALLLGMFRYTRDCFFEQIGPKSKLADLIDGLAQKYGTFFARQSERDMPKCSFKGGIRRGKLMAKEFRGILLVMAVLLRSTKGKEVLQKNKNFAQDYLLKDWMFLVETLLEWEAFLNEPEMTKTHVLKMNKKNRYIMYLLKQVARRAAGMHFKLTKFHVIIHMFVDILDFGVPLEHDTGTLESMHKLTKVAARLTQKNEATFVEQTCRRLDEFLLIALAMADLEGKKMWRYYEKQEDPPPPPPPPDDPPATSGSKISVFRDMGVQRPVYSMGATAKERETPSEKPWSQDVVDFLFDLQTKLAGENLGFKLEIRTVHKREGLIFRGTPDFRGAPWRDWAMFDWGEVDGALPGQIWCFVVIDSIPEGQDSDLYHGGVHLDNGEFAVIESSKFSRVASMRESDIFLPITKEVTHRRGDNRGWKRKFYLANVESIQKACVAVPDVGERTGTGYFVVRARTEWVEEFKAWLDDPGKLDVIGDDEPEPSHGPQLL